MTYKWMSDQIIFFQTLWDFGIRRKLIIALYPWKILRLKNVCFEDIEKTYMTSFSDHDKYNAYAIAIRNLFTYPKRIKFDQVNWNLKSRFFGWWQFIRIKKIWFDKSDHPALKQNMKPKYLCSVSLQIVSFTNHRLHHIVTYSV